MMRKSNPNSNEGVETSTFGSCCRRISISDPKFIEPFSAGGRRGIPSRRVTVLSYWIAPTRIGLIRGLLACRKS